MTTIISITKTIINAIKQRPKRIIITYWDSQTKFVEATIKLFHKRGYKTRNCKKQGRLVATRL